MTTAFPVNYRSSLPAICFIEAQLRPACQLALTAPLAHQRIRSHTTLPKGMSRRDCARALLLSLSIRFDSCMLPSQSCTAHSKEAPQRRAAVPGGELQSFFSKLNTWSSRQRGSELTIVTLPCGSAPVDRTRICLHRLLKVKSSSCDRPENRFVGAMLFEHHRMTRERERAPDGRARRCIAMRALTSSSPNYMLSGCKAKSSSCPAGVIAVSRLLTKLRVDFAAVKRKVGQK